jgi:hypothetical protein
MESGQRDPFVDPLLAALSALKKREWGQSVAEQCAGFKMILFLIEKVEITHSHHALIRTLQEVNKTLSLGYEKELETTLARLERARDFNTYYAIKSWGRKPTASQK